MSGILSGGVVASDDVLIEADQGSLHGTVVRLELLARRLELGPADAE